MLTQCAKTSLTSKLIEGDKAFFADLLVSAFLRCPGADTARDFFEIKTVSGGSVTDSAVVEGLAFKKTFSYAGFEQQPKSLTAPRIALLNVELELKTEHVAAEVRVGPDEYKAVVEAEWRLLYDKLDLIVAAGANVFLIFFGS